MLSENAPKEIPSDISEHRKNKIVSARSDDAKRVLTAAAEVLKAGFCAFGVEEKNVSYGVFENGKPYALSHPDIHFSLSHSENMAVAVFSDSPVGVDCERADREVPTELVRRFFSDEEVENYKNDPLLLWVIGESISKLSGEGVFARIKRTRVPLFDKDTAVSDGAFFEKLIIENNLIIVVSEKQEKAEIISV